LLVTLIKVLVPPTYHGENTKDILYYI